MNPPAHTILLGLYAEWRRLTDLEGDAIGEGAWPEVARQQQRKLELRDQIVRVTQQWHSEATPAEDPVQSRFEREFRPIVTDLIQRETRNHDLLCRQRHQAQSRLASAHQSSARLRGLQRSYGAPSSARWQAYS